MQDQKDLKNAGLKATLPRLKVLSLFDLLIDKSAVPYLKNWKLPQL